MEQQRMRDIEEQSDATFTFKKGDSVEVCDLGMWWPAKVRVVEWVAASSSYRYFCSFPGRRQWNSVYNSYHVIFLITLVRLS